MALPLCLSTTPCSVAESSKFLFPVEAERVPMLHSTAHLESLDEGGLTYLPLCSKQSFVALLDKNEGLMEEFIRHSLETRKGDILIFIADGEVMEQAALAVTKKKSQRMRVPKQIAALSARIRVHVDAALAKIASERIRPVVHWSDVTKTCGFQAALEEMEVIMDTDFKQADNASKSPVVRDGLAQIQFHVKTLVKNLYTQRIEKTKLTNIFTGDGVEMLEGAKYMKRYKHLERASMLELCLIMTGMAQGDDVFTEMMYLTNNPRGMTNIAKCLGELRQTLDTLPCVPCTATLQAATRTHSITFVSQEDAAPQPPVFVSQEEECVAALPPVFTPRQGLLQPPQGAAAVFSPRQGAYACSPRGPLCSPSGVIYQSKSFFNPTVTATN